MREITQLFSQTGCGSLGMEAGRSDIVKKVLGALIVGVIVGAAARVVTGIRAPSLESYTEVTVNRNLGGAIPVTRVASNVFDVAIALPGAYQIHVACSVPGPTPLSAPSGAP